MRLWVIRIVAGSLFAFMVVSCGGGAGVAIPPPTPGDQPSEPETEIGIEESVVQALEDVLASADAPEQALLDYSEAVAQIHAKSPDAATASATVLLSRSSAIRTMEDWLALMEASNNAPSSSDLSAMGASPSPAVRSTDSTGDSDDPITRIIFVNGVATTKLDAIESARHLQNEVNRRGWIPEGETYRFSYFHNTTAIEESALCALFGRGLYGEAPAQSFWSDALRELADLRQTVCGIALDIVEAGAMFASLSLVTPASTDREVEDLRRRVEEEVCKGNNVVLVSHSQGNLFVQAVLEDIDPSLMPYIGVVSVASPKRFHQADRKTLGAFAEWMVPGDFLLVGNPLATPESPDLQPYPTDGHPFSWHAFITSYMAHGNADLIVASVAGAVSKLVPPNDSDSVCDCANSMEPPPLAGEWKMYAYGATLLPTSVISCGSDPDCLTYTRGELTLTSGGGITGNRYSYRQGDGPSGERESMRLPAGTTYQIIDQSSPEGVTIQVEYPNGFTRTADVRCITDVVKAGEEEEALWVLTFQTFRYYSPVLRGDE